MQFFYKRVFVPLFIIIFLAIGFFGGIFYEKSTQPLPILRTLINKEKNKPPELDFSLYWKVWDILHQRFVDKDKLNTQKLLYGSIEGLVGAAGDPYTVFFPPKESKKFNQEIRGSFGGVGIEIGVRDDILTVIAPLSGTPAEKAGVLAGDKIVGIDGRDTKGMGLDEAVNLIRGPKGSEVILSMSRKGLKEFKKIKIKRGTIKVPAIKWKMINGDTAYIQLFIFNQNASSDFNNTVNEILKKGAKKIILDLRNNPGGLLDSAVDIAGHFLEPGQVVLKEKSSIGLENVFKASGNPKLKDFPLVVIINKGSASASEILAGALKDNKGITIVGEKSFGKGSVQQIEELPDKSSIKVTVAKWFTPNGVSIQNNGIEPDIKIKITKEDIDKGVDPQLNKALEIIGNIKP